MYCEELSGYLTYFLKKVLLAAVTNCKKGSQNIIKLAFLQVLKISLSQN